MPEDLVIISKLLDSHTANSPTASSPALSQSRRHLHCPSLSMTIHSDRGAAQPSRHSDCAHHDSSSSPVAYRPRNRMLECTSSPNIYRRSSLMHTSSASFTCSPLLRTSSLPIAKFCVGGSSSPSHIDWDLALGLPPKADEPAEEMKRRRGTRAGRRYKQRQACRAHAQALRLSPPLERAGNGRSVVADMRGDLRRDPRGNLWEEMMADVKEGTWRTNHCTAGNDLHSALSYLEQLLSCTANYRLKTSCAMTLTSDCID